MYLTMLTRCDVASGRSVFIVVCDVFELTKIDDAEVEVGAE